MASARAHRPLRLLGFGLWLVAITAFGLPRALGRHFHVDEIQVAHNAALLGVHDLPGYVNYTPPFVVPLVAIVRHLDSTAEMLIAMRALFFAIFLGNLCVIAWAQPYFPSTKGRIAVLFAASLFTPLWMNGFEIRHDVLTAGGVVVLYGLSQRALATETPSRWTFLVAGIVSGCMQAALKALLYWAPFALVLLLLVPRRGQRWAHVTALGIFAIGLGVGLGLDLGILAVAGYLPLYVDQVRHAVSSAGGGRPFSATPELLRLAFESPVVFALAVLQIPLLLFDLVRRAPDLRRSLLTALFAVWTVLSVHLNPTPFAYNFLYVVPFVFFAALDVAARLLPIARGRILGFSVVALVAVLLFARAWVLNSFLRRPNTAQLTYIAAAEALTSPTDTVLDGVGLVLTRRPPHPDWMVHSYWMADYRTGRRATFASIMEEHASPVILDNYRWGWLSREDLATRDARYVRVDRRLLVLGQKLAAPSGAIPIHRAGRYKVVGPRDLDRRAVRLDGAPLDPDGIVTLTEGPHTYEGVGVEGTVVHWIGPRLVELPYVSVLNSDEDLFTNEPVPLPLLF